LATSGPEDPRAGRRNHPPGQHTASQKATGLGEGAGPAPGKAPSEKPATNHS